MDFIDKKEKLADLLQAYNEDNSKLEQLQKYVQEMNQDNDFKSRALFSQTLNEIEKYLNELSKKEIKQRIMMIRNYLD